MAHQELGRELLERVADDVQNLLKERETDKTLSVLQEQMLNSLPKNVNPLNTVVAYEPV